MANILKKMFDSVKGGVDITAYVIDVALVVALIPLIKSFIATGSDTWACQNTLYPYVKNVSYCMNETIFNASRTGAEIATYVGLNATEVVIMALITLFIVIALVVLIVKQTGLGGKR